VICNCSLASHLINQEVNKNATTYLWKREFLCTAQGATIKSKVIIDIKNSFALGLTYVMLSRITNCSNLDFSMFYPYKCFMYLSKLI
jgi:hypothetical protein